MAVSQSLEIRLHSTTDRSLPMQIKSQTLISVSTTQTLLNISFALTFQQKIQTESNFIFCPSVAKYLDLQSNQLSLLMCCIMDNGHIMYYSTASALHHVLWHVAIKQQL